MPNTCRVAVEPQTYYGRLKRATSPCPDVNIEREQNTMSLETSKLRQIKPMNVRDVLPSSVSDSDVKPEFEWVDPHKLHVEEKYQRNLSAKSIKLIRRIVKDFSWTRLKPPICAWGTENRLYVIDGQHTAIAAASHPKIKKIPVMIVDANTLKDRAIAFMGHNRDRVAITPAQMFYSSVAASDPIALALKKACDETGVTIMRTNPPIWVEGQTLASGTLMKLTERKGTAGVTRVLKILMDAKRAPVIAIEVSALADLLWGKGWGNKFDDYELSTVIRSKTAEQWLAFVEANIKKGMNMPTKRALAIAWYKQVPKIRGKEKQ